MNKQLFFSICVLLVAFITLQIATTASARGSRDNFMESMNSSFAENEKGSATFGNPKNSTEKPGIMDKTKSFFSDVKKKVKSGWNSMKEGMSKAAGKVKNFFTKKDKKDSKKSKTTTEAPESTVATSSQSPTTSTTPSTS